MMGRIGAGASVLLLLVLSLVVSDWQTQRERAAVASSERDQLARLIDDIRAEAATQARLERETVDRLSTQNRGLRDDFRAIQAELQAGVGGDDWYIGTDHARLFIDAIAAANNFRVPADTVVATRETREFAPAAFHTFAGHHIDVVETAARNMRRHQALIDFLEVHRGKADD